MSRVSVDDWREISRLRFAPLEMTGRGAASAPSLEMTMGAVPTDLAMPPRTLVRLA